MKTAVKHAKGNENQSEVVKKASASKKRPKGEWFLKCSNPFTNESVAAALADRAIGDGESKAVAMLGNDGKEHDVLRVPAYLIQIFLNAKLGDPRFKFRIFKRDGPEGVIRPADFLENKKESKKMLEMKKGLRTQMVRKKKEAAKTNK